MAIGFTRFRDASGQLHTNHRRSGAYGADRSAPASIRGNVIAAVRALNFGAGASYGMNEVMAHLVKRGSSGSRVGVFGNFRALGACM
jgi:hypothetical protein